MFWKWLLSFLKGFVPAALRAWLAERKRLGEVADQGAEDQRQADEEVDELMAREAKKHADEVRNLPDGDFTRRRDRWVR